MIYNIENTITTQDELIAIQVNRYDQIMMNPDLLYWDLLTEDFTISKRKRIMNWVQGIAVLRKAAMGAVHHYDDQVDASAELESDNYTGDLEVTNNQYEDDDLDHAAAWAIAQGDYEAIFWQDLLQELLAVGETELCYDGVPFFSENHPVLIGVDDGQTNKNLWSGYAPTTAGLSDLTRDIKANLKTAGLKNAYVRPSRIWVNPTSEFTVIESLGAEIVGNAAASNFNGSKSNVLANQMIKNKYGWAGGMKLMQDHPSENSYYVECEIIGRSPFSKPFVRVIRRMFEMRMYTKAMELILGTTNSTKWQKEGRCAMRFGEPMTLHKVTYS